MREEAQTSFHNPISSTVAVKNHIRGQRPAAPASRPSVRAGGCRTQTEVPVAKSQCVADAVKVLHPSAWEFLPDPESWRHTPLRQQWEALVASHASLNAPFQSPMWLDHMASARQSHRVALAITRDARGSLAGAVPLRAHRYSLRFDISGHTLGQTTFRQLYLLGSEPLLPPDVAQHDALFLALKETYPECQCIGLAGVPASSFLWRFLQESEVIRDAYLPYAVDGVRDYHTIPLAPTFEGYLARFSKKWKYNLKRQLRLLQDSCGAALDCRRIDSPEDAGTLLRAFEELSGKRWHLNGLRPAAAFDEEGSAQLSDLAGRGLLRGYVLASGGHLLACVYGYQYNGVYVVSKSAYNCQFARLSPGSCLLYLAIEDLIRTGSVKTVNLGFGQPRHQHSAHVVLPYASVLLFRKSFGNKLRRAGHQAFRNLVRQAKRLKQSAER